MSAGRTTKRRKQTRTAATLDQKLRKEIDKIVKARDALRKLLREYEDVLEVADEAKDLLDRAVEELSTVL